MGAVGIVFDIEVCDEASGASVRRATFVDINDWSKLVEPKHFPRALVVELIPAHVLSVAESKEAVCWSFRGKGLPGLILVPGTAKGDDAGYFGMLGKSGCGRGSMGGSG